MCEHHITRDTAALPVLYPFSVLFMPSAKPSSTMYGRTTHTESKKTTKKPTPIYEREYFPNATIPVTTTTSKVRKANISHSKKYTMNHFVRKATHKSAC